MKKQILVSLSTLLLAAPMLLAGDGGKAPKPVAPTPPPATPPNPLSFYDGALVFDFQEKVRGEYRSNNFDFNDSLDTVNDDSWLLQRVRLGMKIKATPWLSFYAQGQDTREFDSNRENVIGQLGAEGDDTFDLRQGYIELGNPKSGLSFKVGRQLMTYGDERLIGPLDWANQGRTFDAARFHYAGTDWWLDAFAASVVKFQDDKFNESNSDQILSGLYFSSTGLIPAFSTDIYALGLTESLQGGDTKFVTLGTRLKADPTKLHGWDYETEMAVQFGDLKGKELAAFAGHWGAGYVWLGNSWKPRLFAEYNFATGDGDAKDGSVGTFQNLFPTNHKFYGYADFFSWQNIHNPAVSFSVQPTKTLTLRLDYHAFFLANTNDAWYRANGVATVRPITPGANSFVGTELDATATWKATKNLAFQAGYSKFFAGKYLSSSGANDNADFAYLQASIDF